MQSDVAVTVKPGCIEAVIAGGPVSGATPQWSRRHNDSALAIKQSPKAYMGIWSIQRIRDHLAFQGQMTAACKSKH